MFTTSYMRTNERGLIGMSTRKLNREERKVLRGLTMKVIRFIAGLDQTEISLICRIVLSKMNKMDILTVDVEDDE